MVSPAMRTPDTRRMASRKLTPPCRDCRWATFQWSSTRWSFSGSTSTHRPRSGINPPEPLSKASHSSGLIGSPSRVGTTEKSSNAPKPSPGPRLLPNCTVTLGRELWRCFHQSGMRTTIPDCSNRGISRKKA